jgi:methionine-gamma-lyase
MTNKDSNLKGFGSLAVHGGHQQDPNYSHLTPIYASSTFVYDDAEQGMRRFSGQEEGYIYSRWGNPSFTEAELKIAAMESFGIPDIDGNSLKLKTYLHSSGMAAISTLFHLNLKAGDKVLTHYSLYGGTEEMLRNVLPAFGVEPIIIDLRDLNKAEEAIKANPAIRMLYLETPANPTIQCVDIDELSKLAKSRNILVACDNTFATPYLQQPFRYAVDFVVHSTTKFLNGHGTALGGVLLGQDIELLSGKGYKVYKNLGGSANPFDAYLLLNGMKTLELRMERHCSNAMHVAKFLSGHSAVAKVNYNGLPDHPDHVVAMKQMKHPGAMMSFELKKGFQGGVDFMNKLRMCTRTVSLGTCDTLLCHPASMTHFSVPRESRLQYGITDGLIRMSVGIETVQDILNDLDQALN